MTILKNLLVLFILMHSIGAASVRPILPQIELGIKNQVCLEAYLSCKKSAADQYKTCADAGGSNCRDVYKSELKVCKAERTQCES